MTRVLAVDIGTGTQDILLLDPRLDVENAYKLILPSPTMIVRGRIQAATRRGEAVLLSGVMMGGGPCAWAAEDHMRAGFPVYATPEAARTFNDDLEAVAASGVHILSPDEAEALPSTVRRIELKDLDYPAIVGALSNFGIDLETDPPAALAVAVFDHGEAPPGVSDRQFRFDYLDTRIRAKNHLAAFAFRAGEIPSIMTRLQAVASSARNVPAPLLVMDTAPAAVLGTLFDPFTRALAETGPLVVCNIGNFHTIAFRLGSGGQGIQGVFEHHTGLLNQAKLESLLSRLAGGSLTHKDVFDDMGHGALVIDPTPIALHNRLVVTGPRRAILAGSRLGPHFSVPFGDMMVTGCFGLLAALAEHFPNLTGGLLETLQRAGGSNRAPWDA